MLPLLQWLYLSPHAVAEIVMESAAVSVDSERTVDLCVYVQMLQSQRLEVALTAFVSTLDGTATGKSLFTWLCLLPISMGGIINLLHNSVIYYSSCSRNTESVYSACRDGTDYVTSCSAFEQHL